MWQRWREVEDANIRLHGPIQPRYFNQVPTVRNLVKFCHLCRKGCSSFTPREWSTWETNFTISKLCLLQWTFWLFISRFIDIVAGLAIDSQGHIVAVDSVTPTIFVLKECGQLIRFHECSDFMKEPSDIGIFQVRTVFYLHMIRTSRKGGCYRGPSPGS